MELIFTAREIILTANQRLAAHLEHQYDSQQKSQGKSFWQKPLIFPLHFWVQHLWKNAAPEAALVLSNQQELLLWERIISENNNAMLQTFSIAKLAQQAWHLLHQWNLDINAIPVEDHEEFNYFIRWAKIFAEYCAQKHLVSTAQIPKKLLALIKSKKISVDYDKISLRGFDEITPIYRKIFAELAVSYQIITSEDNPLDDRGEIKRIEYFDQIAEITAMAHWSKTQIEENPQFKIACVIPNLDSIRNVVEAIFTQVFAIENILPGMPTLDIPFNISAGKSLLEYDCIKTALQILNLSDDNIALEQVTELLQSPYFCQNELDFNIAAHIDFALRQTEKNIFSFSEIFSQIENFICYYPGNTWLVRLRSLKEKNKKNALSRSPSKWARYFNDYLEAAGWPGGRGLNSEEYQLNQRWTHLLVEFSALDYIFEDISLQTALHLLEYLASGTLFQPQSQQTPVQILGILETSGFEFSAIWFMNLHSEIWPPKAAPNPFIPYSIQKELNMAHSSPGREFVYAQQISERIFRSAQTIILSSPQWDGDKALRPSPLVTAFPRIEFLSFKDSENYLKQLFENKDCETMIDVSGPAVSTMEVSIGGSNILRRQSECPFSSFASYRLKLKPLALPSSGMSTRIRGILIHHALEVIWKKVKNHESLCAYSKRELELLVAAAIESVFLKTNTYVEDRLYNKIILIEKNIMAKLLLEWLEFEKERPDFVIKSTEIKKTISIQGLKLNLQVDRIDKLADGREIILDYKTGASQVSKWFGPRIKAPQLPLYCVFVNDKNDCYSGIAFAQLTVNNMKLSGIINEKANDESIFSNLVSVEKAPTKNIFKSWRDLTQYWHGELENLAKDFMRGNAAIDPIDNTICEQCHFHSLCRVT